MGVDRHTIRISGPPKFLAKAIVKTEPAISVMDPLLTEKWFTIPGQSWPTLLGKSPACRRSSRPKVELFCLPIAPEMLYIKRLMVQADNDMRKPLCEIETTLSDGRAICLRTIRPSDEVRIRQGIKEMSDRSRYLRFFSAFREPPESVVKRLSAVDGHDHIGWGAILLDGKDYPPIAAAHAIRSESDQSVGELAIAVLDDYQGFGLARALIAALLIDCVAEKLLILEMHVLRENRAAANLVKMLGAERNAAVESVAHYTLNVGKTLANLQNGLQSQGVSDVFIALGVASDS